MSTTAMPTAAEVAAIRRTERVVNASVWLIVAGAVVYSLMTSTPFVARHTEWTWSAPILGLMTDAAFVLAVSADAVLSRYDVDPGPWPRRFRWSTGLFSVFLNVWGAVEHRDWTGVAVHVIAPALLIGAAEVAPVYRAHFARIVAGLREQDRAAAEPTPAPAPAETEPPAETPQVTPVVPPAEQARPARPARQVPAARAVAAETARAATPEQAEADREAARAWLLDEWGEGRAPGWQELSARTGRGETWCRERIRDTVRWVEEREAEEHEKTDVPEGAAA